MDLEKDLAQKRKHASLNLAEWLGFFLLPISPKVGFTNRDDDYTKSELERFEKYGFDKKLSQARTAKVAGFFFWIVITIIVVHFISK